MTPNTHLTNDQFTKLAQQANLTLSSKQQREIHAQLDEALKAIEVLRELDTSKLKLTTSASGLTNVTRQDLVSQSLTQSQALENATQTHKGYFVVPAIFDLQDS